MSLLYWSSSKRKRPRKMAAWEVSAVPPEAVVFIDKPIRVRGARTATFGGEGGLAVTLRFRAAVLAAPARNSGSRRSRPNSRARARSWSGSARRAVPHRSGGHRRPTGLSHADRAGARGGRHGLGCRRRRRSGRVGERVVLSWNPHCGRCFHCERGQPILCDRMCRRGRRRSRSMAPRG